MPVFVYMPQTKMVHVFSTIIVASRKQFYNEKNQFNTIIYFYIII